MAVLDALAAEKSVDEVRTAADRTVEALIALQDELNLTTEQSEGLYRAVLKAEIATARLELTQNDLSSTQQRLYELAARRKSGVQDVDVEIVSCEVIGGPINYGKRLPAAALGAVLTLLTVLLAQWWIIRRG